MANNKTGRAGYAAIKRQAEAAGVSIAELCRLAGVHESTVHRTKHGSQLTEHTRGKIDAALATARKQAVERALRVLKTVKEGA